MIKIDDDISPTFFKVQRNDKPQIQINFVAMYQLNIKIKNLQILKQALTDKLMQTYDKRI